MGICTTQGKMAAGYCLKTAAMTNPKIARTTVNAMKRIKRKSKRTRLFSKRPAMSPTVCPLLRKLTTKAPKSCTAPIRMEPNTTHKRAGTQPHMMAIAGPTIGPVPAIEVKWCPKMTDFSSARSPHRPPVSATGRLPLKTRRRSWPPTSDHKYGRQRRSRYPRAMQYRELPCPQR